MDSMISFRLVLCQLFSFASENRSDVSADWAVMCRVSGAPLQLTSVICSAFIDNACFDVAQGDGYLGRLRGQGELAVVVGQADGQFVRLEAALSVRLMEMSAGEGVGT